MPDNPNTGSVSYGASPVDDKGRAYTLMPDGSKFYLRPQAGSPLYFQGSNGGMVHNPDNWNPKTGAWEPGGVDWGKLIPWLGLAAIGGGVTAAALSSSVPASVATQASASGLGPSTAANVAATSTAAGTVPAALAPSVGGSVPAATSGLGSLGWASLAAQTGTQVAGAILGTKAANKASATEAQAAKDALDFSKQVYADRMRTALPYQEFGARSLGTLGDLLGIPAPKTNAPPMATDPNHVQSGQSFPASWVSGSPLSGTPQTAPGNGSPVGAASNGTVTIQAPDGSRRAVPAGLQTFYVARGGTVV